MPLRNRVTPLGEIVAVAARGTLMGNRGILHDDARKLLRDWQVKRWIACRLEFRGRHRAVLQPGHYTELFFLDEAVALADGHRPCAECRNADYRAFQAAWRRAFPDRSTAADDMDRVLHAERRTRAFQKNTHQEPIDALPDGAYVLLDGGACVVRGEWVLPWSAEGYGARIARPSATTLTVLTPASIVATLRAGYQPGLHPSAATPN